jgi:hypothetical protein
MLVMPLMSLVPRLSAVLGVLTVSGSALVPGVVSVVGGSVGHGWGDTRIVVVRDGSNGHGHTL